MAVGQYHGCVKSKKTGLWLVASVPTVGIRRYHTKNSAASHCHHAPTRGASSSGSEPSRSTASMPNQSLSRVRPEETSFRHDVWLRWRQRRWERNRGGRFLHGADRCVDRPLWNPLFYGRHGAPLPAITHTTINLYIM